jgi:hypothetical protein
VVRLTPSTRNVYYSSVTFVHEPEPFVNKILGVGTERARNILLATQPTEGFQAQVLVSVCVGMTL